MQGCARIRRAVSPVLATIMLVAITLATALAVAGFLFGLMGTFTDTVMISAGTASCTGTPEVCTISFTNSGSGAAYITGLCTMTFGGSTYQGTALLLSGSLNGGSSGVVACTAPGSAHDDSGSQLVGTVGLGNGLYVMFTATAS